MEKRVDRNKRKKRRKKKKLWPIVLISMIGLFIVTVGGGYFYVTNMLNKMERVDINEGNLGIDDEVGSKYKNIQNIALFGIDAVGNEYGRSDSTMVLTIDRDNKKIKLTSLMRDSYVDINGHGKDKLNHAYAFGGPELAIKTINETFGLNIKDFATVNFSSLPKIIDILGGIDIDIDSEEINYINDYIYDMNKINKTNVQNITKTGVQHLNGTQAMAYCRIRYTSGGDYKRTERHREVLEKIFEEIQTLSPSKYPTMLNEVLPMVKTDLNANDILSLGTEMLKISKSIEQERFPKDSESSETMINSVYYLKFNEDNTKKQIQDWIFRDLK